jgi:hypothetical protein
VCPSMGDILAQQLTKMVAMLPWQRMHAQAGPCHPWREAPKTTYPCSPNVQLLKERGEYVYMKCSWWRRTSSAWQQKTCFRERACRAGTTCSSTGAAAARSRAWRLRTTSFGSSRCGPGHDKGLVMATCMQSPWYPWNPSWNLAKCFLSACAKRGPRTKTCLSMPDNKC